jgi:hypothetical protein
MNNIEEIKIPAYKCLSCGKVYTQKSVAETCCKQYHCTICGADTPKYWLKCRSCIDKERYEKANKIKQLEWEAKYPNNMVCLNERFYSSIDDLLDYYEGEDDIPTYCWGTDEKQCQLDAESIMTNMYELCEWEDAEFSDDAALELKEFAEQWNKKHAVTYFTGNNTVILIGERCNRKWLY